MFESNVDLNTTEVGCCKEGCVAFTAGCEGLTAWDVWKEPRFRAGGKRHKKETYRPLLSLLKTMLPELDAGAGMCRAMTEAREAAAASPYDGLSD